MNQFKRFLLVAWKRQQVKENAQRGVRVVLRVHAKASKWSRSRYVAETKYVCDSIDDYVRQVDLASRKAFWERLTAWWQLAHVPVVYLLALSAVAHVVAVHLY
jgi:hypothetical protein